MVESFWDFGLPRVAFKYDSGGRRISSQLQVEMPYQPAGEHFLLPDGRLWFVEDGTGDRKAELPWKQNGRHVQAAIQ